MDDRALRRNGKITTPAYAHFRNKLHLLERRFEQDPLAIDEFRSSASGLLAELERQAAPRSQRGQNRRRSDQLGRTRGEVTGTKAGRDSDGVGTRLLAPRRQTATSGRRSYRRDNLVLVGGPRVRRWSPAWPLSRVGCGEILDRKRSAVSVAVESARLLEQTQRMLPARRRRRRRRLVVR